MASQFSNYGFGKDGVNLVKNPLHLGDGEATQLQNAELRLDAAAVGEGAIGKRGGLAALNAGALSSTVLGMIGLNLKTGYTRTLYVGLGTAAANTFRKTTNGTVFTNTSSPLVAAVPSKFADAGGSRDARRIAAFRNFIVYPYNTYTVGTDNPIFAIWDGTDALQLTSIPVGPSATASTPAYAIVDMLTANGKIYFAIHDPGGAGANLAGRVMSLNLETGVVKQVATSFGNGTGETTGGYPCCLCWYQDQLWAGLQTNTTTDGIGKIVRCYPDVDADWTSDVSTLSGLPCSLAVYKGDLYAGVQSSVASNCKVYKRPATTRTWAASFTSAAGTSGNAFCTSLIVYGTDLYAAEYFSGGTDVLHIKKWDGSSWTTDRDVDASDGVDATNPQMPGNSCLLGDDLFWAIRTVNESASATDGYVLRKSAGTWSKVDAAINCNGMLAVLVERS
jgi:hypothetical protein